MPRKGLLIFLLVIFAAAMGISRAFSEENRSKEMRTLEKIVQEVQENYVTEVEPQKLFDGAYRGVLQTLDPYSQFLDKRETTTFTADTEGRFGGLGIEISVREGLLTVVAPIRGTPAYEAGILPGDVILKINGKSTERITVEDAVRQLRGEIGTKVVLTVRHVGSPTDTEIAITRVVIHPSAVEWEMIDAAAGIALMRVSSFTATVMETMAEGVRKLQEQHLKALILDLRQNPGGLLEKSAEMADLFLPDGVIVSVKGRRPEMAKVFRAHKGGPLESTLVVVVIDEYSASASEILAAALHDHKRALLIGAPTYGKGSVQNVIPLGDGEALKLTTARYYTPNDKPIEDHHGIMPDIYAPMSREQMLALRRQEQEDKLRNHYHLGGAIEEDEQAAPPAPKPGGPEGTEPNEPPARRTRVVDFQLKAALNILRWQLNGMGHSAK